MRLRLLFDGQFRVNVDDVYAVLLGDAVAHVERLLKRKARVHVEDRHVARDLREVVDRHDGAGSKVRDDRQTRGVTIHRPLDDLGRFRVLELPRELLDSVEIR